MTYSSANIQFERWDVARKQRVVQIFEALCRENILNVREAFVAAVEDECKAIETEKVLGQAKDVMQ